ncbi:MAG: hypothetical protein KAS32_16700 [Candidatus Peribacteraceae bacterium]|nr:hypothetical protein [Candidatus Peribacteraceae bacterium]
MNSKLKGGSVNLEEFEQKLCRVISKYRFESNRSHGVKNAKIGKQDNEFTDLEGIGAEIAFCKLFNVYPSESLKIAPVSSTTGNDKGDAILPFDLVIDIKATKYPNGKLLAVPWKTGKGIDYYALMIGEFPSYIFKGFMHRDELINNKRKGDLGHGETYIAEQHELIDFCDVIELLKQQRSKK